MSLPSLKSILKKLMVLNTNRMAQIRDQYNITSDENAEYEERYREAEWYTNAMDDIEESERLNTVESGVVAARDTLRKNIQVKLESRYDEILDKTRKLGAGTMRERVAWGPERRDDSMSMEDRKFLESCGIKTERGESW